MNYKVTKGIVGLFTSKCLFCESMTFKMNQKWNLVISFRTIQKIWFTFQVNSKMVKDDYFEMENLKFQYFSTKHF